MITELEKLAAEWLRQKEIETNAQKIRRDIEDHIKALADVPEHGATTVKTATAIIKASARIERKVDVDAAQEVAAEFGLTEWLPVIFRWKPEVNTKAFDSAPVGVQQAFSRAITAKPSRPSFSIAINTQE